MVNVKINNYSFIKKDSKIFSIGSCFSENIKKSLSSLTINSNPFGVTYNPYSIYSILKEIVERKNYKKEDFFFYNSKYYSLNHTTDFQDSDLEKLLKKINNRIEITNKYLKKCDFLIITIGTALVYILKENNFIVNNCHKLPHYLFENRFLEVEEIVFYLQEIEKLIFEFNNKIKIIYTISPIRHYPDDIRKNTISKALLNVGLHRYFTQSINFEKNIFYFPSYEYAIDIFRDSEYYSCDMVHLNEKGVSLIMEKFQETFLNSEAKEYISDYNKILIGINHKPKDQFSKEYYEFIVKQYHIAIQKEICKLKRKIIFRIIGNPNFEAKDFPGINSKIKYLQTLFKMKKIKLLIKIYKTIDRDMIFLLKNRKININQSQAIFYKKIVKKLSHILLFQ